MSATFRDVYLPAVDNTEAGAVWRISYFKPDRRPGVVSAYEGVQDAGRFGTTFTCDIFGCRKYRRQLAGRATKRAIGLALADMLSEMRDAGVIPADRAERFIQQATAV